MDAKIAELLATGGTLASYAGLGTTILQWIVSNRERRSELTVGDYLEWLRRNNHNELVERLTANHSAIDALELVLDETKNAVLEAITEHEFNSQNRHDALVALIMKAQELDTPILKITTEGLVTHSENLNNYTLRIYFLVVNTSNCIATITGGKVRINDGTTSMEFPIRMNWNPPLLTIPPSGGAHQAEAYSNAITKADSPDPFNFESLEISLAQEPRPRLYVPTELGFPLKLVAS